MIIKLERTNTEQEFKIKEISAIDLIKKLKLTPGTVLIAKNNELVTENTKLTDKDYIKIIPVVSGG